MKSLKLLSLLALLLISGTGGALADHGRSRVSVGMYFGPPVSPWYYGPPPYYYYPPAYYPPRVVVVPAAPPPVYIEQSPQPPAPPPPLAEAPAPKANYWYYCRNSQAYYPYVRDCPEGWEQVVPQPQAQPR